MCFKLEMAIPFSAVLRVLPVVIQTTLGEKGAGNAGGEEGTGAVATSGGMIGQMARMLPAAKFLFMMMAYVKLLTVRNGQLEDDIRVLRGLKVCHHGYGGGGLYVFGVFIRGFLLSIHNSIQISNVR